MKNKFEIFLVLVVCCVFIFCVVDAILDNSSTKVILEKIKNLGLMEPLLVLIHVLVWIAVISVLSTAVVWLMCKLGKMINLPIDKMLDTVKDMLDGKLINMKDGKFAPFKFSMAGLKIEASGIIGKIIFITILGALVTSLGVGFEFIGQIDILPSDLDNLLNATKTDG